MQKLLSVLIDIKPIFSFKITIFYKYKCEDYDECPHVEICKHKAFSEKIKPYSFESMNKIHTEFLHGIIHETIPECESVDGYFKGKK